MALRHTRSHSSGFWNDYGCGRHGDWPTTAPAPRPTAAADALCCFARN